MPEGGRSDTGAPRSLTGRHSSGIVGDPFGQDRYTEGTDGGIRRFTGTAKGDSCMVVLIRTAGFVLIPILYIVFDWLNYVQAGKLALVGLPAVVAVSAWTTGGSAEGRWGRVWNLVAVLLFQVILGYQAFLRDIYGVAQDDIIILDALFNTDGAEVSEFILQNAIYLGKHLAIVLGMAALYWALLRFSARYAGGPPAPAAGARSGDPVRGRLSRSRKAALGAAAVLLLVHLNPTMRKEDPLLYFPLRYAKWKRNVEKVRESQERIAAAMADDPSFLSMRYTGDGPRSVVFVIGESTTRLNWSMFGYERPTTPQLESLGDRLLRFRDVVTTTGSTVGDIGMMLGPANHDAPHLYQEKPDIISMARKAGYKTFWISNHSTDATGTIAIMAGHADENIMVNRGGSRTEGSHDEVVLPYLERALDDPAPLKFIVLHLLGAHPAFRFRYPESFARFDDAEDAVAIELREAGRSFWAVRTRNHYDNAMLYADHVLRATIDLCAQRGGEAIAWLFTPDHGEDVAHYTNFAGHNTRVLAMYEIPLILWRSPAFPAGGAEGQGLEDRPYQTDDLDHTILGLLGLEGEYYDPAFDILSPDFRPAPRVVAGRPYPWRD
ncbi:MAG: phosphoethanolamine transferase [bacterium]|nr:MAG: phosphoethanolamine transferase [bacterium]